MLKAPRGTQPSLLPNNHHQPPRIRPDAGLPDSKASRRPALPWRMAAGLAVLAAVAAIAALAGHSAASEPPAVTGKNNDLQISGTAWFTWRYKLAEEPALESGGSGLGRSGESFQDTHSFDMDRLYLTLDYLLTDRYTWNTVIEASNQGGNLNILLKRAGLRIKEPFGLGGTSMQFGQIGHPMTGHVEGLWGYRVVSRTPVDRYMGISTTWLGVSGAGSLLDKHLEVEGMLANPKAFNQTDANDDGDAIPVRSKYVSLMARTTVTPLPSDEVLKGLALTVFGQYAPNDVASGQPADAGRNNTTWLGFFPHYSGNSFRIGLECYRRWHEAASDSASTSSSTAITTYAGGFGSLSITEKARVFARLDWVDPGRSGPGAVNPDPYLVLMAGASRQYNKAVRGILDVEYVRFEDPDHGPSLDSDVIVSARIDVAL